MFIGGLLLLFGGLSFAPSLLPLGGKSIDFLWAASAEDSNRRSREFSKFSYGFLLSSAI